MGIALGRGSKLRCLRSDSAVILGPFLHEHMTTIRVGGTPRVGVCEQFLNAQKNLFYIRPGAPAVLAENAQTDVTLKI